VFKDHKVIVDPALVVHKDMLALKDIRVQEVLLVELVEQVILVLKV
jgi:hypothetical protein